MTYERSPASIENPDRLGLGGDGSAYLKPPLNEVKDYVLSWESDESSPDPRRFLSKEQIERLRSRRGPDPELPERTARAVRMGIPDRLRGQDGLVLSGWLMTGDEQWARDAKLVRAKHRPMLRARMAHFAYELMAPHGVDPPPLPLGQPEHDRLLHDEPRPGRRVAARPPLAEQWAQRSVRWLKRQLDEEVGPNGEWGESHHYVHVSTDAMMPFVIAAKRAGFHDFFADGRLKHVLRYISRWSTLRRTRATANSDPAFSKHMQLIWRDTGYDGWLSNAGYGGYEHLYPSRELPGVIAPASAARLFVAMNALSRRGSPIIRRPAGTRLQ